MVWFKKAILMNEPTETTQFGAREVPLADKQALVDDVFRSVARRYDLMNDLMSFGLHRAWKDALVTAVNPPKNRPFALLDIAGGTGDVAMRVLAAGGAGTRATVCDINPEMLAVGRERAGKAGLEERVTFTEGNAEALPFADRSFDAATIAFGIRNVPRIEVALAEAFRVLKIGGRFVCLEFSAVNVPGLDRLYEFYSFNVIPALGRAVVGDAEILPLSGGIDPPLSQAAGFRRHDASGGFCARFVSVHDRRYCRAVFRLAFVISAFHLVRIGHAGFIFAREGVFGTIDPALIPPAARPLVRMLRLIERPSIGAANTRLSAALTRLGPSYVKLGQFLATRPDVVGAAAAQDLERLQDQMPPFPQQEAEAAVAASFGRPLHSVFASFGPPVAAASIAQVHRAEVLGAGGPRAVAVKLLRPGIERRFYADLRAFDYVAHHAEDFSAEARRLRLVEVVDTLRRTVAIEMDFRLEAAALSEMAENTKDDPDFRVPAVDWDRTTKEVLTLEWIDATPLSDRARLVAKGFDLRQLARALMQTFLRHALRDGFFHADMHPGNLFVDDSGRLIAVDFGIMGRLGVKERLFLAEILHGFITRDYRRTAEVHFEAGYVPAHHSVENFAQAIRAIGEPIHNRTAEDISMARLLTLLFEVTGLFDMRTRPELLLLQKTMVVVEGVARSLDPKLDIWSAAEPVVREWMTRHLGPAGKLEGAAQGAAEIGRFIGNAPGLLTRGVRVLDQLDEITRGGLVLSPQTIADIDKREGRRSRWSTIALWVIAALLLWIVILLMR